MENFLRKYSWALTLVLIGVGALLLALTANNILASKLAPYTVPELPEFKQPPAARASSNATANAWDQAIARRCLFGCVEETAPPQECPGGCADGEQCVDGQCVAAEDTPVADSNVPVLSDLNLQLMGAMVAGDPQLSMALVRDESTNATLILGVGDPVSNDAEIIEIRRDRIIIRRNGRLEYIRMDKTHGAGPSATTASTLRRRPAKPSPSTLSPTVTPAIAKPQLGTSRPPVKKVDEGRFEVKRQAIREQLKDRKAVAAQGRIVPNYKDGERAGLKLVGVSPNSIYTQLGIQSGDVLRSLNGKEVNSTQQAMDLFKSLQTAGEITVEIERRGQKKSLNYKVR